VSGGAACPQCGAGLGPRQEYCLECGARLGLPGRLMHGAGQPAIVVDRPVAEDFEILRLVAIRCLRFIQRVKQADAFNRRLRDAIHFLGLRQSGSFKDRRRDIDDMVPLRTDLALALDTLRPMYRHAVGRTPVA